MINKHGSEFKREIALLRDYMGATLWSEIKNHNVIIAGGALTSVFSCEQINDIDIFCSSKEDLEAMKKLFFHDLYHECADDFHAEIINPPTRENEMLGETESAITIQNVATKAIFQLVKLPHLFYGVDRKMIIESFDFTISMASYFPMLDVFQFHNDFFTHLAQRRLVFNPGTKYPFPSLFRSKKFMKRGYKLSNMELMKIALACHDLKMESAKDLKGQLMGVDIVLLRPLWEQLDKNPGKAYDFNEFLAMLEDYMEEVWGEEENEQ